MGRSGERDLEVLVLLGTSFARIEHQGTRWRAVLRAWAEDPRVRRLVAVDFPKLTPRYLVGGELAVSRPTWLEGCELVEARIPVHRTTTLGAAMAWRRSGRAVRELLGEPDAPRLALAATPLSAPLLPHLGASAIGFDAVDDWRALPAVHHLRRHVARGYRSLTGSTTCTSVSEQLAATLATDFGIRAVTVPNGVDLSSYRKPQPAPEGLPSGPFAVYVGVVQQRLDLDLIEKLAATGAQVVVAGPAEGAAAERLQRSQAIWLGRVDVGLVPGLLQRAAVGLIPHVVDPLTLSMDPMKLLEYLAAGLRVVTTPVTRSVTSERVVEASSDAFVAAARAALAAPRLRGPDPAVAGRDWTVVAERLLQVHEP